MGISKQEMTASFGEGCVLSWLWNFVDFKALIYSTQIAVHFAIISLLSRFSSVSTQKHGSRRFHARITVGEGGDMQCTSVYSTASLTMAGHQAWLVSHTYKLMPAACT